MQKNKIPYLTKLVQKLAPKIGARVVVEPEWSIASQIIYKNGIVRSLRMYSLDLNHIASADIARDKDFAKFFIKKRGYPVAEGRTFFEDNWAKTVKSKRTASSAPRYAKKLGFPVIVKPNSKSQGAGVCLVWNTKELRRALSEVFRSDKVAIIERYLPGKDYRIVILDGKVISAYERIPLSVMGDGKTSVLNLLKNKQKKFIEQERDTKINLNDLRIKIKLKRLGFSFKSILPKGRRVFLLDNANLSTGGDALDVTNVIHKGFYKIAAMLTGDMGLRMAGVDIMTTKGDITKNPKDCGYYIIEINAAPGLDHYVITGTAQRQAVEAMYLKVLKALGKKD
ncbi:MAG: cyanophycin synthetase [Candidatus Nomurabacteria bacterium GW2011_GWB1_43_7]|uniref:Cyanophycin synthetase n=1 Tax=Candidatus Nomurabacteria bacterium GW2011_GWB1_43_7 TaxID=1618747 RepID=A0A0G1FCD8_9BACT|nr:MAG: cyanophycin synthetase [Candidatus Nomurabacteria bacterium GW2011_GWB1_43_7]